MIKKKGEAERLIINTESEANQIRSLADANSYKSLKRGTR